MSDPRNRSTTWDRVVEVVDVVQDPELVGIAAGAGHGIVVGVEDEDERSHQQEGLDGTEDAAHELVDHRRLGEQRRPAIEDLDRDRPRDVDRQEAAAKREHVDVGRRQLGPVLRQPGAHRVAETQGDEQGDQGDGQPERPTQGSLDVADDEEGGHEEGDQDVEEIEPLEESTTSTQPPLSDAPGVLSCASPYSPATTCHSTPPLPVVATASGAREHHNDRDQARRRPPWVAATASTSRPRRASTSPSSRERSSARTASRQARPFSDGPSGDPR